MSQRWHGALTKACQSPIHPAILRASLSERGEASVPSMPVTLGHLRFCARTKQWEEQVTVDLSLVTLLGSIALLLSRWLPPLTFLSDSNDEFSNDSD